MATPKTETRSFQIRAAKDNDFKIEGYAATFGTAADIGGMFKEVIAPGAFARSLAAKADIHATVQHDFSQLLGRTTNSSLELVEDERGLKFSIQLDENVAFHKDTYANVRSGLLNECSFIFTVEPTGEVWSADAKTRTLTDVSLIEISLVALPCYPGTSADARALAAATDSAALLAKIASLPLLWEQQSRAHAIALEISRSANTPAEQKRSADDEISDEDFDDAQEALLEKFGRSANGHAPAHWLVSMSADRCRTLHMDSQVRCRCSYTRDDTDESFDFGDVEPDTDYCEPDDRSTKRLAEARQIQADSELRQRMANAAGRSK